MLGFLARVGRPSVWDKPGLGWPCSGNQEDCSFLVTTGVVHQPLACFFLIAFYRYMYLSTHGGVCGTLYGLGVSSLTAHTPPHSASSTAPFLLFPSLYFHGKVK